MNELAVPRRWNLHPMSLSLGGTSLLVVNDGCFCCCCSLFCPSLRNSVIKAFHVACLVAMAGVGECGKDTLPFVLTWDQPCSPCPRPRGLWHFPGALSAPVWASFAVGVVTWPYGLAYVSQPTLTLLVLRKGCVDGAPFIF